MVSVQSESPVAIGGTASATPAPVRWRAGATVARDVGGQRAEPAAERPEHERRMRGMAEAGSRERVPHRCAGAGQPGRGLVHGCGRRVDPVGALGARDQPVEQVQGREPVHIVAASPSASGPASRAAAARTEDVEQEVVVLVVGQGLEPARREPPMHVRRVAGVLGDGLPPVNGHEVADPVERGGGTARTNVSRSSASK